MKSWFLLIFMILILVQVDADHESDQSGRYESSNSAHLIKKRRSSSGRRSKYEEWIPPYTYESPSGKVIEKLIGMPIFTSSNSYLRIDNQSYYWDESAYQATETRPVICKAKFDKENDRFRNIFLLEDVENSTESDLWDKLNQRTRPKMVIFDCEAEQHCCDGTCCNSRWLSWLLLGIVGVSFIFFCCYCSCWCAIKDCGKKRNVPVSTTRDRPQRPPVEIQLPPIPPFRQQVRQTNNAPAATGYRTVPTAPPEEIRVNQNINRHSARARAVIGSRYSSSDVPPSYDEVTAKAPQKPETPVATGRDQSERKESVVEEIENVD